MRLSKQLSGFQKKFNPLFFDYLQGKEQELIRITPEIRPLFSQIKKIASAGKRLRPFLCWLGYKGFGGKGQKQILKVGVALELLHLFALIHDDIMDKATKRREVETIHSFFAREASDKHFGQSVGILAGDLVFSLSEEIFQIVQGQTLRNARSDLMQSYWQKLKKEVMVGQFLDLNITLKKLNHHRHAELACHVPNGTVVSASLDRKILKPQYHSTVPYGTWQARRGRQVQDDKSGVQKKPDNIERIIMKIMELKTARYTVLRPLQIGAALAGANLKEIEKLEEYALPVGLAFQIRDDLLDCKKDLPPVILSEAKDLVRKGIAPGQKEKAKEINLVSCKGERYCQELAEDLVKKAKKALKNVKIRTREKKLLVSLADFMVERKV